MANEVVLGVPEESFVGDGFLGGEGLFCGEVAIGVGVGEEVAVFVVGVGGSQLAISFPEKLIEYPSQLQCKQKTILSERVAILWFSASSSPILYQLGTHQKLSLKEI